MDMNYRAANFLMGLLENIEEESKGRIEDYDRNVCLNIGIYSEVGENMIERDMARKNYLGKIVLRTWFKADVLTSTSHSLFRVEVNDR